MVYLVRHGESEWNRLFGQTRRDPGIRDPSLTALGREQALAASIILGRHGVRRLIASPYRRAIQTAGILAEALGAAVEINALFGEHAAFSCDEGTQRIALSLDHPHLDLSHLPDIWWPAMPEGEMAFRARMKEAQLVLAGRADRDELAVVCHWGVIRALTGQTVTNGTVVPYVPLAPDLFDPQQSGTAL